MFHGELVEPRTLFVQLSRKGPSLFRPLEVHQIEGGRGNAERRQNGVSLSPMVRLMVEKMGKGRRNALADRAHISYRGVGETPGNIRTAQSIDPVDKACIFFFACRLQFITLLEEDHIQCLGRIAFTGEAMQPDTVGHENMVERSMHGFEEGTHIAPVCFLIERKGGFIQPLIRPAIIGREHAKMLFHQIDFLVK